MKKLKFKKFRLAYHYNVKNNSILLTNIYVQVQTWYGAWKYINYEFDTYQSIKNIPRYPIICGYDKFEVIFSFFRICDMHQYNISNIIQVPGIKIYS